MPHLYWQSGTDTVSPSQRATDRLGCNSGDEVYGGGVWIENPSGQQEVTEDAPSGDLTAWFVEVTNNDVINTYTFHFYALCGPKSS